MKITTIIPVYNEGESVRTAFDRVASVFGSSLPDHQFELIFVDDGSTDDSFKHLSDLAARHVNVRVIKLAANAGSHMAIRAGLEHATGDVASFLACDLQDPPEAIPEMLRALVDPIQLVWAVRDGRQDSLLDRVLSGVFHQLGRLLVSKNIPPSGASMILIGPRALRTIKLYKERNLTLDGLLATMGYRQAYVKYHRQARQSGASKWTLAKRLKLFADQFVGYSYTPIRLMSYMGIAVMTAGFLYGITALVRWAFFSAPVGGWSMVAILVLLLSGVHMAMLGVLGEYVWRALDESRGRPRYVIETTLNLGDGPEVSR